ncbi:hypothetical protein D3C72_606010 [compost metagenome]
MPANTGEARAIHRGACFAGEPAPTGPALVLLSALTLKERVHPLFGSSRPPRPGQVIEKL